MEYNFQKEEILLEEALKFINYTCFECGNRLVIGKNRGKTMLRCTWKFCRKLKSALWNTIFENSKLTPLTAMAFCNLWLKETPKELVCEILKISKKTVR